MLGAILKLVRNSLVGALIITSCLPRMVSAQMASATLGGNCKKVDAISGTANRPLICANNGKRLVWKKLPGGSCRIEGAVSGTVVKPWVCTRISGKLKWLAWGNAHLTPVLVTTTTNFVPTKTTVATPTTTNVMPTKTTTTTTAVTTTTTAVTTTTTAPHICSDFGDCSVGDTGPGGGIVFYDAGSAQSWGRYIEVTRTELLDANGGIEFMSWTRATNFATTFVSGGKSDWRLPSKVELSALYLKQELIPGHACKSCWSSTEQNLSQAWALDFTDNHWWFGSKVGGEAIRLVRVFG